MITFALFAGTALVLKTTKSSKVNLGTVPVLTAIFDFIILMAWVVR